jgi:hypothetical protein
MEGAINASFEQGEEGFCRISMELSTNVFLGTVINSFMAAIVVLTDPLIRAPVVGDDYGFLRDVLLITAWRFLAVTLSTALVPTSPSRLTRATTGVFLREPRPRKPPRSFPPT